MDEEKALKAITSTAAKNCWIDDRVGTLEVGKDADIAVFTDLPTRFESECVMTFIDGKCVTDIKQEWDDKTSFFFYTKTWF